ncbi:carboxypeptidase M32 [Candidatus Pacearchaeota archaeon]|nr:carboxypeptidase M32 [Candidatus Pacearchaeota archaeon]
MEINRDLELVKKYQKEIILINQTIGLLEWDQQTYMPKEGAKARAEQHAFLGSLSHEKIISDELFSAIERLKKIELSGDDRIMIERVYRDASKARKLPKKFIEELSKTASLSFNAWQDAKKEKDFELFKPHLEKIIGLKKKEAKFIRLEGHPYNSLLDSFEEGMTSEELKPKFEELKKELINLLRKIEESETYKSQKRVLTKKEFPREYQMHFVKDVSKRIGLGEDYSRVDFAEHPFMVRIGTNDLRITTNIKDDPFFSFGSSIHESGHALYELNLPIEHEFNFLCDASSYGLHESQSKFWENMIGLSESFWKYYFEKFNSKFELENNFDKWLNEVNFVFPGKIRVEADEVHYCLHVILRFEIELDLIEGTIEVKDLPQIWNEKMQEYFGVIPENDSEGVMQDVHWSQGTFGYFPTYAIGTIYATQLFEALRKEFPEIEKDIEIGDYSKIKEWLRENIHKHGRKFTSEDIIKNVCNEGLNPGVYIKYLNDKYSKIYHLK